jgi:hypothetical protein
MTPEQIQFCNHVEQGERELAQALLSSHENLLFQTDEFGMNPVLICIKLKNQIETSAAAAAATDTTSEIIATINSLILDQLNEAKLKLVLDAITKHHQMLDCVRDLTDPMRTWLKAAKLFLDYAKTKKYHSQLQYIQKISYNLEAFSFQNMELLIERTKALRLQSKEAQLPTIPEDIEGEQAAMAARNAATSVTNDPVLYRRRPYRILNARREGIDLRQSTGSMQKQSLADSPLRVVHSDESVPQSSSSKPNL